jgi:drug/metabolite transporter (DMT)-like permease
MWFWWAILSAVFSAISIILNKKALKSINASLVSWALFAFSIPFLIYPAFKDGWPKLNFTFGSPNST